MNGKAANCGTRFDREPDSGRVQEARRESQMREQSNVAGIVLAGVHPWGNCALEQMVSRPLVPIATRPLIWHVVDWLGSGDVHEACICGNSATTVLRRSMGSGEEFDLALDYCEDHMPRGPAGCARDAALGREQHAFVVVDGTIIPRIDLQALVDTHLRSGAALTVVTASGPADPHSPCAPGPAGIYVFSRTALEDVPTAGYQDIKETLIPSLYRRGERIVTYASPGNSIPRVTGAASYLAVNMWAVQWMVQDRAVPAGYRRIDEAWIHRSAQIDPTARLVGPVLVGPKSAVGPDVMIVGPASVGADSTIEPRAVISRSAVWDRCRIGQGAVLDQCILTDDAGVGAELVVRNTVCGPPSRSRRTVFDWLASCVAPNRPRARHFDRGNGRSRTCAADGELKLFDPKPPSAPQVGVTADRPGNISSPVEVTSS